MYWRCYGIVKIVQGLSTVQFAHVEQAGKLFQLGPRLSLERAKKMPSIQAGESVLDCQGTALEVEGHGDGSGGADLWRHIGSLLPEPLEQHVSAE